MGYTRACLVVRFGTLALIAAQLAGCATARDVTRGAGTALGVAGALALLVAFDADCDPDQELCPDDEPYYEEETLETRAVIAASGGAAVVIGGALVAASDPPKRRRKRPASQPAPVPRAAVATNAPDPARALTMRELIEKRCVPQGGIDLRVSAKPDVPRPPPPTCEANAPAQVPDEPGAPVAPGSGAR